MRRAFFGRSIVDWIERIIALMRDGRATLKTFMLRVFGRASPQYPWHNRDPIREELFSVERIEEHARSLAIAQPVAPRSQRGYPLASRLAENAAALSDAHRNVSKKRNQSSQWFGEIANITSRAAGRAPTFVAVVLIWATTGPLFDYSDTWQLVINTGTTIVAFLMVFLI
jgi:hypothetical protein